MKAFLYDWHVNPETDTIHDGMGTDHAAVTREYGSLQTVYRYAILPFIRAHGNCHAYIFKNWANRYGKADKVILYSANGQQVIEKS